METPWITESSPDSMNNCLEEGAGDEGFPFSTFQIPIRWTHWLPAVWNPHAKRLLGEVTKPWMEIALPTGRKRILEGFLLSSYKYQWSIFAPLPVAMDTKWGTHVNIRHAWDTLKSASAKVVPLLLSLSPFWLRAAACSHISKPCGFRPQTAVAHF